MVQVHWKSCKEKKRYMEERKERAEIDWDRSDVQKDLEGNEKRKRELNC